MHDPNSPQPLESGASIAQGFALMLESACEDFEILQRMIRGELILVSGSGLRDFRAPARIQMALAKSFLFHLVRARRICEHGAGSLKLDRLERTRLLKGTAAVVDVRDVNEHGFDAKTAEDAQRRPDKAAGSPRSKISKPSMHSHEKESAILDETAMIVLGDQKILMGPLNLYDFYAPTDRMRKLAGFASLPPAFPLP